MKMRSSLNNGPWAAALLLWASMEAVSLAGMTAAQLREKLGRNETVHLIDVRKSSEFQAKHIVGAINVPVDLCGLSQLPALGPVVVYGGGLAKEDVGRAVSELNRMPGISAEELIGGLAAWEEIGGVTTQSGGLSREELNWITYAQVKTAANVDLVLVDLREAEPVRSRLSSGAPVLNQRPLTDLGKAFPGKRVVKAVNAAQGSSLMSAAGPAGAGPLMVLIDDGASDRAQGAARALRASGRRRLVILAGGEEVIVREGRSGLQRQGQGIGVNALPSASTRPAETPGTK